MLNPRKRRCSSIIIIFDDKLDSASGRPPVGRLYDFLQKTRSPHAGQAPSPLLIFDTVQTGCPSVYNVTCTSTQDALPDKPVVPLSKKIQEQGESQTHIQSQITGETQTQANHCQNPEQASAQSHDQNLVQMVPLTVQQQPPTTAPPTKRRLRLILSDSNSGHRPRPRHRHKSPTPNPTPSFTSRHAAYNCHHTSTLTDCESCTASSDEEYMPSAVPASAPVPARKQPKRRDDVLDRVDWEAAAEALVRIQLECQAVLRGRIGEELRNEVIGRVKGYWEGVFGGFGG